jgi:hypothetical protein
VRGKLYLPTARAVKGARRTKSSKANQARRIDIFSPSLGKDPNCSNSAGFSPASFRTVLPAGFTAVSRWLATLTADRSIH